jgi:3-hydroxyisobutyrate dehydrogenase-like beta-hydroxyacid dehydrogenase
MSFDLALIGFGEAGSSFARDAGWRDRATAYDRKTDDPSMRPAKLSDYAAAGVIGASGPAEMAASAPIILSLVTADQALAAAEAAARHLRPGTLFCDGNSVAPSTKRSAARCIEQAGGRYIDMAIMAPVDPARLSVPLLLSGAAANEARTVLGDLGFSNIRIAGEEIGRASSIKMIRSIMVKGLEALTAECVLAASRAGVLDEVLASLDASEKAKAWGERADYNLDRMLVHGIRRAAEMKEVARTIEDLGLEPAMTRGTIARQDEIGRLGIGRPEKGLAAKLAKIEAKDTNPS